MLKLVTQFDNPEMRPSVATPTCDACCCCSCVVTQIVTGIITSRNVAHAISAQQDKNIETKSLRYKLLGGFSFPLAIIGGILTLFLSRQFFMGDYNEVLLSFIVVIGMYLGIMAYLVKKVKLSKKVAIATIILSIIGMAIEFYIRAVSR